MLGLVASVLALLAPARSFAQEAPKSSLVVTRGDGTDTCPDSSALAEQVRRLTGADVLDSSGLTQGPRSTYTRVAISRDSAGFHADITAAGQRHGTRTLDDVGPTCAALADAISVTIAIFLDPYAAAPVPTPPEPSRLPQPARATTPPLAEPTRLHPFLQLDASAAFGMLHDTAPVLAVQAGLHASNRWSIALGGAFAFPDTLSDRDRTITLGLSYGYAVLCGRVLGESASVRLDWCFEPMLGVISGSGHGYDRDTTERALWAAGAAGPALVLPIAGRFAWTASALGVIPFIRQSFDVTQGGAQYLRFQSAATAASIAFGVRGEL